MSSVVPTTKCSPDTGDKKSISVLTSQTEDPAFTSGYVTPLKDNKAMITLSTTGSNTSLDSTVAYCGENDKTITSADETVIEKRSWKQLTRKDDTREEGEIRSEDDRSLAVDNPLSSMYSTIDTTNCTVITSEEDSSLPQNMYSSFISSTIDSTNCTVIAAEADSTNNDVPDAESHKKRKRNWSAVGNEFTPKQLKLAQRCSVDDSVSPIDFMTRSADCVKTGLEEQIETPLIGCKFELINSERILNSTPIAPSHSHSKVVRKAMFRNTESGKGTPEDILGFLEKQAERIQCSENKENKHEVENISKIDISILGNDSKDSCTVKDKTVEASPEEQGRFKDVDATVASAGDIENEDMTEDILGLEDDGDVEYDEIDADKTLVADKSALWITVETHKDRKEQQAIDASGDHVQNKISGNIVPVPKPEDDKDKSKDTITISIDFNFNSSEQKTKETISFSTDVKKTQNNEAEVINNDATKVVNALLVENSTKETISISNDVMKAKDDEAEGNSNDATKVVNVNAIIVENKHVDAVKKSSETVTNVQTEKKPAVTTEVKKSTLVSQTDDTPTLDVSVFDTSHCRLEDINDLMTEVCQRWESHGVPCQDTNLTIATAFRINNQNKGLEAVPGDLEGDKLCCLHLYENEIDSKYNQKHGKESVQSMHQTVGRLREQLECLEQMRCAAVEKMNEGLLWQQEEHSNKLNFKMQRLTEMQDHEYNQAIWRVPSHQRRSKQQYLMRLNQEHAAQRNRLQHGHQRACHNLQLEFDSRLEHLEMQHGERTAPINQLLEQLETSQQANIDAHEQYGPLVTIMLKKAPCKESRRFTSIKVCLPAAIAQAMSQEDVIMDHFYKY